MGKLGKAAVGTVMLPVDVLRDLNPLGDFVNGEGSKVAERAEKIAKNVSEAVEGIDE